MATPWGRVFLVFGLGVVAAAQLGIIAPAVPLLEKELGLSLTFLGWVISAITLVSAVLGVAIGSVTARIGDAAAVKIGLVVMAVLTAAGAFAWNGPTLLLARVLDGGGYLLVVTAAPSLLAHIEHEGDRAIALSIWAIFVPVGIALAGILASLTLDSLGWRGLQWADAALTTIAFFVALIWVHDEKAGRHAEDAAASSPWTVMRERTPVLLALGFCAFTFTFLALAGLLPSYLIAERGLDAKYAGQIVAVTTFLAILGGLIAGWLMRIGVSAIMLAVLGLVVPAVAAVAVFAPSLSMPGVVAATGLAFAIGELTPAAVYAAVPQLARDARQVAPINGLLAQLGSFGTLVGPPVFAAWTGLVGWSMGPVLLLAIAAAGSLCLFAIRHAANPSSRA